MEPHMSAPDFTENDPKLGPLPVWDLSALYASPDDPKITQDFEWSTSEAEAFSARWKGRLETCLLYTSPSPRDS